MNISFAYSLILAIGLPFVAVVMWWHVFRRKVAAYKFPLTRLFILQQDKMQRSAWRKRLLYIIRGTILLLLVLVIARPQEPDERSKVPTEGVAIALVLDVSGSMESFDDLATKKSRFKTAQEEAIRFINKRPNDLFGLVLFGALAVSRCPLTADKKIVTDIIRDTRIGLVNPQGTVLSMGIAMAVNRLRNAEAKSKVMVVLTDGEPSPHDMRPTDALALAKKAGIKIYTIGIGSDTGGYMEHPFGGVVQVQTPLNEQLLSYFAEETGGAFFKATNQRELAAIYDHIDALEKSAHDAPVYTNYYEWYVPLLMAVLILLLIECSMCCWPKIVIE